MIDIQNAESTQLEPMYASVVYILRNWNSALSWTHPVIRLGGHREEHETGWECAAREVIKKPAFEESLLPHP